MPAALRAAGILPPHQSPKDQPELYNKLALPRVGGRVAVGYVVCILALFRCRCDGMWGKFGAPFFFRRGEVLCSGVLFAFFIFISDFPLG
jgi:hypothetical protein